MIPHRTTTNGTIDYDHYIRRGEALRSEAMRSFFTAIRSRLATLVAADASDTPDVQPGAKA